MVSKQFAWLFTALAVGSLYACSGDEPEPALVAEEGQMVARVEGETWKSAQISAFFRDGYLTISGLAEDGSALSLGIKGGAAATYQIETEPDGSTYTINSGSFTPANASLTNSTYSSIKKADGNVGGVITLTEFDSENKLVSGTFDIRVSRSKLNDDGSSPNPPEDELITMQGNFNKIPYTENISGPAGNTASAKINGNAFTPSAVGAAKSFGNLVISLTNNSNQTIGLNIPDNIAVGTYDLGSFGVAPYVATYSPTSTETFDSSNGGKLNIISHDAAAKRIEGTFNFNGTPFPMGGSTVYTITEGRFATNYH